MIQLEVSFSSARGFEELAIPYGAVMERSTASCPHRGTDPMRSFSVSDAAVVEVGAHRAGWCERRASAVDPEENCRPAVHWATAHA